jgi:hypothetical protein
MENYIMSNKTKFKEFEDSVNSEIEKLNGKNMNFKIIYDETPSPPNYPYGHIVFLDTETGEKLIMDYVSGYGAPTWDRGYPRNEKIKNIRIWSQIQREVVPFLIKYKIELLYDKMSPEEKKDWNWQVNYENDDSKSNGGKYVFTNPLTGQRLNDINSQGLPAWAVINLEIQMEQQGEEITAPMKADTDRITFENEEDLRKVEIERRNNEKSEDLRKASEIMKKIQTLLNFDDDESINYDNLEDALNRIVKALGITGKFSNNEAIAQAILQKLLEEKEEKEEKESNEEEDEINIDDMMSLFLNINPDIGVMIEEKKKEEELPIGLDMYNQYKESMLKELGEIKKKISFCIKKQNMIDSTISGYKKIRLAEYGDREFTMTNQITDMNENTKKIDFYNLNAEIKKLNNELDKINNDNFEIAKKFEDDNNAWDVILHVDEDIPKGVDTDVLVTSFKRNYNPWGEFYNKKTKQRIYWKQNLEERVVKDKDKGLLMSHEKYKELRDKLRKLEYEESEKDPSKARGWPKMKEEKEKREDMERNRIYYSNINYDMWNAENEKKASGGSRKINTYKKRKQNKIRKTNKRRKTNKTNKGIKTIKRRKIIKRRNTYKK